MGQLLAHDFLRQLDPQERLLDIHLIAMNYHWSKETINHLPVSERKLYVELIKQHLKSVQQSLRG